jgi:hypothetical protein
VVDLVNVRVLFQNFVVEKGMAWCQPPPIPELHCDFAEILDVYVYCGLRRTCLWVTTVHGRIQVWDDLTNFKDICKALTEACRGNPGARRMMRPTIASGYLVSTLMDIGLILAIACILAELLVILFGAGGPFWQF